MNYFFVYWLALGVLSSGCASLGTQTSEKEALAKDRIPSSSAEFPTNAGNIKLEALVLANSKSSKYCPDTSEGDSCKMVQQDAWRYCFEQKMHLPTTRELSDFSKQYGGQGRIEVAAAKGAALEGYYLVKSLNPMENSTDGKGVVSDEFYMNHQGYKIRAGGLGMEKLWTASEVPGHPGFAHVFYGELGGGGGNPLDHKQTVPHEVRCILGLQ